jgi:hypothetical protein
VRNDETALAGPCTEESLEDVLLHAAALVATTSERAIRRTDQAGDRIVVRRSELLALAKVVETAAPTLIQRLRDRISGDTRPYSAPGMPDGAPERAREIAETMPTIGQWPGLEGGEDRG